MTNDGVGSHRRFGSILTLDPDTRNQFLHVFVLWFLSQIPLLSTFATDPRVIRSVIGLVPAETPVSVYTVSRNLSCDLSGIH